MFVRRRQCTLAYTNVQARFPSDHCVAPVIEKADASHKYCRLDFDLAFAHCDLVQRNNVMLCR